MKRVLVILLVGMMLPGALAGCVKKEEAVEPTMQLDMAQMLETAAQPVEGAGSALREQLEAPEHVSESLELADGKLTIEINGDVVLPNVGQIPAVRVKPAQFSQELVKMMFQRLTAGHTLYNRDIYADWTKEQLQSQIEGIRSTYDNDFYYDDREAYITDCELEIQQIEERMKSAPDTLELVQADGTLIPLTSYDRKTGKKVETHMGMQAQSDFGDGTARGYIHFQVHNDNDLTEAYITNYDNGKPTGGVEAGHCAKLSYNNNGIFAPKTNGNYGVSGTEALIPIEDETIVPTVAQQALSVTPQEARKAVEKVFEGTDMAVTRLYLISANDLESPVAAANMDYAYVICCTRQVLGVNCSFAPVQPGIGAGWEDFWTPRWSKEYCEVMYNDDGIMDFHWNAPVTVSETVVENSKLLPFAAVMDVFEKMVPVVNDEWLHRETLERILISVDRIELCLERIDENEGIESGLLVPVWKFYGLCWIDFTDGGAYNGGGQSPVSVLTINAVDGSVITGN